MTWSPRPSSSSRSCLPARRRRRRQLRREASAPERGPPRDPTAAAELAVPRPVSHSQPLTVDLQLTVDPRLAASGRIWARTPGGEGLAGGGARPAGRQLRAACCQLMRPRLLRRPVPRGCRWPSGGLADTPARAIWKRSAAAGRCVGPPRRRPPVMALRYDTRAAPPRCPALSWLSRKEERKT